MKSSIVRYHFPTLVIVFLLGLSLGCAGKKVVPVVEIPPPVVERPIPVDLKIEPAHESIIVQWKRQGEGLISGYNIYIHSRPGVSSTDSSHNFEPFPGDTNPDDGVERYEALGLENGKRYYVTVRVIYPDRSLSALSDEATTVCGPHREITLDHRFSGEHDGFALGLNRYVRADSDASDLYFFTKDGEDFLASPDRLNGYNRKSTFGKLPFKGSLAKIRDAVSGSKVQPSADKLAIKTGDWILIRTADRYNGLLRIIAVDGKESSRKITLEMSYCPAEGEMVF
jgi:hypothetical protein